MGVTFTAPLGPEAGYVIGCCMDSVPHAPKYGTWQDAEAALATLTQLVDAGLVTRAVLPGCTLPEVCPSYPLDIHPIQREPRPEVEIAMTNAVEIVGVLGYGHVVVDGLVPPGQADAGEFLARVVTALALAPADEGVPERSLTAAEKQAHPVLAILGGGDAYTFGRRPGYVQDILRRLHDLATWCQQRDLTVRWY